MPQSFIYTYYFLQLFFLAVIFSITLILPIKAVKKSAKGDKLNAFIWVAFLPLFIALCIGLVFKLVWFVATQNPQMSFIDSSVLLGVIFQYGVFRYMKKNHFFKDEK